MEMHNPAHPGQVLQDTMGDINVTQLAEHLGMSRGALSRILNGRAAFTPEFALKISETFPPSGPEFWMNMQVQYDIAQIRKMKRKKLKPIQVSKAA